MNFNDWSEEIVRNLKQAQSEYWAKMAEQQSTAGKQQTTDKPDIAENMEKLWSVIRPQIPKQADDAIRQAFDFSKHPDFTENLSAFKAMVDALVESQLHSFGIPSKQAHEALQEQVDELIRENQQLKARIVELEKAVAQNPPPEEDIPVSAKKISKPGTVKKVVKSQARAKPMAENDD